MKRVMAVCAIALFSLTCTDEEGRIVTDDPGLTVLLRDLIENSMILTGAQAYVEAGGRSYAFDLFYDDADELLVGGCFMFATGELTSPELIVSANFAETWPSDRGDRFSFWTPGGFPPGASVAEGAEVQLGLFDHGSGESFVAVPGGRSFAWCNRAGYGQGAVRCHAGWFGRVSETSTTEKSAGLVQLSCTFVTPDSPVIDCAQRGCDDGNPCTRDTCRPITGICDNAPIEGELLPASDADLELDIVRRRSLLCDADGNPGVCLEGACVEDPCDEDCQGFGLDDTENTCTFATCSWSRIDGEGVCVTDTLTECLD